MGIEDNQQLQEVVLDDLLNEFSDIFAAHPKDFGLFVDTVHSIDVGMPSHSNQDPTENQRWKNKLFRKN